MSWYKENFEKWLKKTHPDIELYDWQQKVVDLFDEHGIGPGGKTFLLELLRDFEIGA